MRLVDTFYKEDNRAHGLRPDGIDYNQFKIDDDGKTFCWTPGGGKKDPNDKDEGGGMPIYGFIIFDQRMRKRWP